MTVFSHRPTLRWALPLLAALVLIAGGSTVGLITASARGGLPDRSASRLLVDVQRARLDGLSGTIVQDADLGLPQLPGVGGSGSSDMTSLVAGSHTLRLWYAGPDRVRLALLGSLGESDLVRNGSDMWVWSSKQRTATHRELPATGDAPRSLASVSPVTPQQAAEAALKAVSPSTEVSTDGTAVVAGRSAYELVLRPRDDRSLVSSVRIAVDGRTHVPTRVQVYADGVSKPALSVGFTSFDPSRPDASVFRFNPPPGTKVKEGTSTRALPGADAAPRASSGAAPRAFSGAEPRAASGAAPGRHLARHGSGPLSGPLSGPGPLSGLLTGEPRVVGTGWTSVVVANVSPDLASPPARVGSAGPAAGPGAGASALLAMLPEVSGSWGKGRLLRGTLFSALVTDDGHLVMGAVRPELLYAALPGR
jgi:outer membrane lipoprotein-sorting protein